MKETDNIQTKEDFIVFLKEYYMEFKKNGKNWENNNLDSFLEALLAYAEDVDGYYINISKKELIGKASWRSFADLLCGAAIYE